jgi:hypothetical protein
VVYLCSPLSSATNGAALRVDSGVVRACFKDSKEFQTACAIMFENPKLIETFNYLPPVGK